MKRYNQFIKESVHYDVDKEQIQMFFNDIHLDEIYQLNIHSEIFNEKNEPITDWNIDNAFPTDDEDFFVGWSITIRVEEDNNGTEDLTDNFRDGCQRLLMSGYKFIEGHGYSPNGYNPTIELHQTDIEEIRLKDGKIYVQMDETTESCNQIDLFFCQTGSFTANFNTLKSIFNWEGEDYVIEMIDELAKHILNRNTYDHYHKVLLYGVDSLDWDYPSYNPDAHSAFRYYINEDNAESLIKIAIKAAGSLKEFVDSFDRDEVRGKSEKQVIEYLKKKPDMLSDYEWQIDVYDEVIQTIGNWLCLAHQNQNLDEMYREFDKIVSRHMNAERQWKTVKMHLPELEKTIEIECYVYRIDFSLDWCRSFSEVEYLNGQSADTMFHEWTGNNLFQDNLEPSYSDYGDVDEKELNKELSSILKNYL